MEKTANVPKSKLESIENALVSNPDIIVFKQSRILEPTYDALRCDVPEVVTFRVAPKGASFHIDVLQNLMNNLLPNEQTSYRRDFSIKQPLIRASPSGSPTLILEVGLLQFRESVGTMSLEMNLKITEEGLRQKLKEAYLTKFKKDGTVTTEIDKTVLTRNIAVIIFPDSASAEKGEGKIVIPIPEVIERGFS